MVARALVACGTVVGLASVGHAESLVEAAARERERRSAQTERAPGYTNLDLGWRAQGRRAAARSWRRADAAPRTAPVEPGPRDENAPGAALPWAPPISGGMAVLADTRGDPLPVRVSPGADAGSESAVIRDIRELPETCTTTFLGGHPRDLTVVHLGLSRYCLGEDRGGARSVSVTCVDRPRAYDSCLASEYVVTDARGEAWWSGVPCRPRLPDWPSYTQTEREATRCPLPADLPQGRAVAQPSRLAEVPSAPSRMSADAERSWSQRVATVERVISPDPAPGPDGQASRPWAAGASSWSSPVSYGTDSAGSANTPSQPPPESGSSSSESPPGAVAPPVPDEGPHAWAEPRDTGWSSRASSADRDEDADSDGEESARAVRRWSGRR